MKVFVYYNLHKHLWSVKALEGENKGRVIDHTYHVTLKDCEFKVSQAGRNRVLREKRKNVHAGVVGHLDTTIKADSIDCYSEKVTYNPYLYNCFVTRQQQKPIYKADLVYMNAAGEKPEVFAYYP